MYGTGEGENRVIDIHCHILPDFDDGASDLSESLAMVRSAVNCGVTAIVATPHFRGERESLQQLNRLVSRYRQLAQAIAQAELPLRLYPGAEILCLPGTVEMAQRRELPTLGNTQYLLTEFFFDESLRFMEGTLDGISRCGYTPVVAHPERYEAIQRDPRVIEEWFRRGYVIQLNKGSVLGAFGRRPQQAAQWLLGGGLAHIIASDAHSSYRRTTDMGPLREMLLERYPGDYVRVLLERNPERLVRGEAMVPSE